MSATPLRHFDVLDAKQAYAEGRNVTELLRRQRQASCNTPEIIELAYDIQAGAYIDKAEGQAELVDSYCRELASMVAPYLGRDDLVLDVGTGEITILSGLIKHLHPAPRHVFAFDISWSRLYKGLEYIRRNLGTMAERLSPFAAEIGEIPLPDKAVDVTISNHALEPNGGQLEPLIAELFRVTRTKLVLFEPCYEMNSDEERLRMDNLGYIKDVEGVVERLGGRVICKQRLTTLMNPLNPTFCFVIEPPVTSAAVVPSRNEHALPRFTVPGTSLPLDQLDGFHFSNETGLCFPTLKGIPILRNCKAVLATALSNPT